MKDPFNRDSTRFQWGVSPIGHAGSIPDVMIAEGEPILPLDKVAHIQSRFVSSDNPHETELYLKWRVESGGSFFLNTKANDARLQNEYRRLPEFGERMVQLLYDAASRLGGPHSADYAREAFVAPEEIPVSLQPFFAQVHSWKDYFRVIDNAFLPGFYASVNADDCYVALVRGTCFSIPQGHGLDLEDYEKFRFDPKTHPPFVGEIGASWEVPEKKVVLVVPHKWGTAALASHFGYSSMYEAACEKEKARKEEELRRFREGTKKIVEDTIQGKAAIRAALFGGVITES